MKIIKKIDWKFPDHNCLCVLCNVQQAAFIIHYGGWNLPVCLECSELDENKLSEKVRGV